MINVPLKNKNVNNGKRNILLQNIMLKESFFEKVSLGMLWGYPVKKLKLTQQSQLLK